MDSVVKQWVQDDGELLTVVPIAVAIFVVLVTIVVFIVHRKLRSRRNTVILIGLNDAGKTVIFSKLINNCQDVPLTYTSFKVNEYQGFLADNGRQLNLVDFPGSERLRKQLFSKYLHERRSSLKAVVFVVDSSTFGRKARDVAELFYDALYESGKQVPFLVACSKQDSSTAKSAQAIRSALEREFGLINGTRSAALETTNGDREKRTLTDSGKNFQWSDLSSTGVEFVECCAVSDREEEIPDLEPIKKWISSL